MIRLVVYTRNIILKQYWLIWSKTKIEILITSRVVKSYLINYMEQIYKFYELWNNE